MDGYVCVCLQKGWLRIVLPWKEEEKNINSGVYNANSLKFACLKNTSRCVLCFLDLEKKGEVTVVVV